MTYQESIDPVAGPRVAAQVLAHAHSLRALLDGFEEGTCRVPLAHLIELLSSPPVDLEEVRQAVGTLREALASMPFDAPAARSDVDAGLRWHGARLDEAVNVLTGG